MRASGDAEQSRSSLLAASARSSVSGEFRPRPPKRTALLAAMRLAQVALGVEALLARRPDERRAAMATCQRDILALRFGRCRCLCHHPVLKNRARSPPTGTSASVSRAAESAGRPTPSVVDHASTRFVHSPSMSASAASSSPAALMARSQTLSRTPNSSHASESNGRAVAS